MEQVQVSGDGDWRTVATNGYPPCDGHTTYIGINSAGYACCFNAMHDGLCVMTTAEGSYRHMSDLRDWRLLERPTSGVRKAEPAGHEDDIAAVIACLGDDAAALREENDECEIAANMEVAAATIASLCKQLDEARASTPGAQA